MMSCRVRFFPRRKVVRGKSVRGSFLLEGNSVLNRLREQNTHILRTSAEVKVGSAHLTHQTIYHKNTNLYVKIRKYACKCQID